jgi:CRISPR-associated protein (TIGR03984 family)
MDQQYDIIITNSTNIQLDSIGKFEETIKLFTNAKAVVWYEDKIVFYAIVEGGWNEPLLSYKNMVRLRLFDAEKELHIWRSNGVLKGRLREDGKGDNTEFINSTIIMNGTSFKFSDDNKAVESVEEKGTKYKLPYLNELSGLIGKTTARLGIITRNYIDYTANEQAGYIDSRFVDFKIM